MKVKNYVLIFFMMALALIISACTNDSIVLKVKNNKDTIVIGVETLILETTVNGSVSTGVTYSVIAGAEYATINENGRLTVSENTPPQTEIKVRSTYKNMPSNTVTIIAIEQVLLKSIIFDQTDVVLSPGESFVISYQLMPQNTTETDVELAITKGASLATINDQTITILETAQNNDEIKVVAKRGQISSTFTITVRALESIRLDFRNATSGYFEAGSIVRFTTTITPLEIEHAPFEWIITNDYDKASFENGILFIDEDANLEDTIKVAVKSGLIISNELTITIGNPDRSYNLSANDSITIYNPHTQENTLSFKLYDADYNEILESDLDKEGISFEYNIIGALDIAQINLDKTQGFDIALDVLGHGQTQIEIKIAGTTITKIVTIKAVNTPDSILFDDVFVSEGRQNGFTFAKNDVLPFGLNLGGTAYSNEVIVTFEKFVDDAWVTTDLVTYNFNAKTIAFETTGRIRLIARTNSGNAANFEKIRQYEFNINDGINVYTWEELHTLLHSASYNGQIINLVKLNKTSTYGYAFVPSVLLNAQPDTNVNLSLLNITTIDKDVNLQGNFFTINMSMLNDTNRGNINLLVIKAVTKEINVSLKNLTFIGNSSISGLPSKFMRQGIHIKGEKDKLSDAKGIVYLDMSHITVKNFETGMRLEHVINGKVSNVTVENNYSNGIESVANIINFANMTYNLNGAFGLELTPDSSHTAGHDYLSAQRVTFSGYIVSNSAQTGNSPYLNNLSLGSITIPQVITGSLSNYSALQVSHVANENQELHFMVLLFNDISSGTANSSILDYTNPDGGGIIHLSNISTINTTHQYIMFDLNVQGLNIGKVVMYNWHYQQA